jgi:hypothetical protein
VCTQLIWLNGSFTLLPAGEHIHPSVGRCNRESNCGYHYTPKQYFQVNFALCIKPGNN